MHTMIQEVRLVCDDGWPEVSLDVTLPPSAGVALACWQHQALV